MSVTLDVYQKVYPSVRASVCISYMVLVDDIWMSVTLDVYQKVYPSVRASVCISYMVLVDDIWMSVTLDVNLTVHVCPSVCLYDYMRTN